MQRPSPGFGSKEKFVDEMSEEMFYPNLQSVWRRHAGAHDPDELQHGGQKPTETSVTDFCYKGVDLLLEELINIKVILFLILEKSRFFNLNDSSLGRHANAASHKSLEIQAYSITKPRTLLKRKFV